MTETAKELQRILDCPDVVYHGLHLPTLARLARDMNSPTHSDFAEYLWRLSNTSALPVAVARRFMLAAGYEPFVGFPLRSLPANDKS
jgi:hypothetical protein